MGCDFTEYRSRLDREREASRPRPMKKPVAKSALYVYVWCFDA